MGQRVDIYVKRVQILTSDINKRVKHERNNFTIYLQKFIRYLPTAITLTQIRR